MLGDKYFKHKINNKYDTWDFMCDGKYDKANLKGKWKRKRRKHQRFIEKRYLRNMRER